MTIESAPFDRASRMPKAGTASAFERSRVAMYAAFGREDRLYYLCQILGWGTYTCLLFALMASQDQAPAGAVLSAAAWTGTGLLCTHLFRTYTKKYPLRGGPQPAIRLAMASLLIAAAMVAVQTAANELYWLKTGLNDPRRSSILLHLIQAELVATAWCALYLSVHEVRRRRAIEVEALRLALVAQAAQFHTLRAQLNPHFLFNCLNNLRELISDEPERAERLVTELAELLRYTLQADRVETVPLSEEIHAVRQYLSLEKVRFEERLRLRFEIEPGALAIPIPPMLLQTLTENALKHGIAKLPGGGEVAIHAYLKQRRLEVVITNPGSLASHIGSTGVGLHNARERLRLIYDSAASLSLQDGPGQWVEARVTLPLSVGRGTA